MNRAIFPQTTNTRSISLQSGVLHLKIDRHDLELDQLCGFASRRSRKRGFVFVSKVLGKHYPVRPHVMVDVQRRLASKLRDLPGPAVVVAMAETATGLGHGVYEQLWQLSGRSDLLFVHGTRYRLHGRQALRFDESHSHATEHLLYVPAVAKHCKIFQQAAALVLVDDEISTGRTLVNLALAYQRQNPGLKCLHLVCLTDWLGSQRRAEMQQAMRIPVHIHSVLAGEHHFESNECFDPGPIPDVTGNSDYKDRILTRNFGRLGLVGLLGVEFDTLKQIPEIKACEKVLVLGTGEFAYAPFLLAHRLEELGHDVHFQTTTRSPLLVERDLQSVLEFRDNYHDDIPNYVYNVMDKKYDRIIIGYETQPLPAEHRLAEMLNGEKVFF